MNMMKTTRFVCFVVKMKTHNLLKFESSQKLIMINIRQIKDCFKLFIEKRESQIDWVFKYMGIIICISMFMKVL
jgi:hypothetical protein